ncbi:putative cytochrome P450 6a19 [Nomia melanderi]|uniref:putative cytochrome P450 6a19 n=1 Tax=Nomia melanderi TaxID=2448451 RepID=UPI003FCCF5A4
MESTTLTLLLGALVLLVLYMLKKYTYWQRRGITVASGFIPFLGHTWPIYCLRMSLQELFERICTEQKNRSMFGIYDMFTPALVLREAALVKTVLQGSFTSFHRNGFQISKDQDPLLYYSPFFNEGQEWMTGRKRLTYAFSGLRLKVMFSAVSGVSRKMQDYLERRMKTTNKYETEMKSFFGRFTAETVANAGMGVEGYSFDENPPPDSFHDIGTQIFNPMFLLAILNNLVLLKPGIAKVLKLSFLPRNVDRFFRNFVDENLELRVKNTVPRNDFFQVMVDFEKEQSEKLNKEVITSHALTFFFDGFETSRLTLSFITYQLAIHQDVQQKVRDEIKSVIAKYDGALTYDALKDLKYMEQVMNEAQRCHSALVFLRKECTEEFVLEGSDGLRFRVEPGTQVLIPVEAIHHDPTYWKDPMVFDPERFSEENKPNIEKMSFIPFGEGPRMCVGMRMAILVMKSCLATLLNDYKIELSPKTKVPLRWSPCHFLCEPRDGIWMNITKL